MESSDFTATGFYGCYVILFSVIIQSGHSFLINEVLHVIVFVLSKQSSVLHYVVLLRAVDATGSLYPCITSNRNLVLD